MLFLTATPVTVNFQKFRILECLLSLLVYYHQKLSWVISHHCVTLSLSLRGHLLPSVSSWCRHDVTMSVSPASVPSPQPETVGAGAERRKAVSQSAQSELTTSDAAQL